METLLKISRTIDLINEWIGRLVYWLVLVMVLVGAYNALAASLGKIIQQKLTSNTFLETQWYLFAIIFLLGAAYTLKHNEHVRVDLFYRDASRQRKALINLLGTLLFQIPFSILAIYFSWQWTLNSWAIFEVSSDPGGLPRYPLKSMIIVSFSLLILQGISEAIKNWVILKETSSQEDN